ncbi:hypothetical protein ID866_6102 [Astraeus odoratus]|nr:hypothetical protein ID866_6102 [Astraeus odoratus]
MSLVAIRVELPAYSHSFAIEVPVASTIADVKQVIFAHCVGRPRPEGQRMIWRGRCLEDAEKISELWPLADEQRIIHLSVQPSAWTTSPPHATPSSSSKLTATAPVVSCQEPPEQNGTPRVQLATNPISDESLAFIQYKHWQALYVLSNFKISPPGDLPNVKTKQSMAKLNLERRGYRWPEILDSDFPKCATTTQDPVEYDIVTMSGKPYLSLRETGGTPNDLQLRAIKVLTYTFSILSLPPAPLPVPTPTVQETRTVPPEVNDLLQHLGLPPLRAIPNANVHAIVQPGHGPGPADAEPPEVNLIREIPIRALLAPLLMVVLRTVLLLYFFAPTRKPILGLCIAAWIVYEMWTHVRIVVLQPLNRRDGEPVAGNGPARPPHPPNPAPHPHGNEQVTPDPLAPNADDTQSSDEQFAQGPHLNQSNGIVDTLALMNIYSENQLLWPMQHARITDRPTFSQRALVFLSLLISTLHPEVHNRRRTALSQREGRLRMDMNAMEHPEETENAEPSREELRRQRYRERLGAQHARRAPWVQEYIRRVRGGDWIDIE